MQWHETGFFSNAIDNAASTPSAEDHRIRSFQSLHAFKVIEVAVVLDIVANTIHEEIGRRTITPDNDLVPVILALMSRNARDIPHHIADVQHQLITDLLLCDHSDRLWDITQRRQCFRAAADGRYLISR